MKKTSTICLALILLVTLSLVLTACGQQTSPYTLHLTVTWFNGLDPNYVPHVEEYNYAISRGESLTLPGSIWDGSFRVTKATDNSVTIKTSEKFIIMMDGLFSWDGGKNTFEIVYGEPLDLMTPTLDAGTNYTFELRDPDLQNKQ